MAGTGAIPEIVAAGGRGVTAAGGDGRARILGTVLETVLGIVLHGKTGAEGKLKFVSLVYKCMVLAKAVYVELLTWPGTILRALKWRLYVAKESTISYLMQFDWSII